MQLTYIISTWMLYMVEHFQQGLPFFVLSIGYLIPTPPPFLPHWIPAKHLGRKVQCLRIHQLNCVLQNSPWILIRPIRKLMTPFLKFMPFEMHLLLSIQGLETCMTNVGLLQFSVQKAIGKLCANWQTILIGVKRKKTSKKLSIHTFITIGMFWCQAGW